MCVSDGQKRAVAARRATVFGFDEARKKKLAKRNVRFRVFQADCSSARKNISARIPYAQTVTDFVTVFSFDATFRRE
jgi:RecA/RadA recombinase